MNIFVSSNLDNIKEELKKRGHEISRDNDSPYDAIICNLKNEGLQNSNFPNNLKDTGTLIIDVGGKSIEEIENILDNKIYSSIF